MAILLQPAFGWLGNLNAYRLNCLCTVWWWAYPASCAGCHCVGANVPHTLTSRPIVVAGSSQMRIVLGAIGQNESGGADEASSAT